MHVTFPSAFLPLLRNPEHAGFFYWVYPLSYLFNYLFFQIKLPNTKGHVKLVTISGVARGGGAVHTSKSIPYYLGRIQINPPPKKNTYHKKGKKIKYPLY